MLLDKRFLFGVLNGTITVYFTKVMWSDHRKRRTIVDLKEHNIRLLDNPRANCKYGVVVTDEELMKGGYKSREDFETWCKAKYNLLSENDEIGVANIELHVIKEKGKDIFKELGLVIPKVNW